MLDTTRQREPRALTGAGRTARLACHHDADFFDPPTRFDGPYSGLHHQFFHPVYYHGSTAFVGIFPAAIDAIRGSLPSDALHPVQLPDGRGAVVVAALMVPRVLSRRVDGKTHELSPYGAVSVSALCTRGGPAPRGLPLLQPPAPERWRPGQFVLHMPETALEPVHAGRLVYNFPKFVADIDVVETPTYHQARVEEAGRHLLTLRVQSRGPALRDRKTQTYFTSRDARLMRTEQRVLGFRQIIVGASAGSLELGDHPVAQELRDLRIEAHPMVAFNYLTMDLVLPAPEALGPAQPYDGYGGTRRDYGRWTITYPASEPVDLYAHRAAVSPE